MIEVKSVEFSFQPYAEPIKSGGGDVFTHVCTVNATLSNNRNIHHGVMLTKQSDRPRAERMLGRWLDERVSYMNRNEIDDPLEASKRIVGEQEERRRFVRQVAGLESQDASHH